MDEDSFVLFCFVLFYVQFTFFSIHCLQVLFVILSHGLSHWELSRILEGLASSLFHVICEVAKEYKIFL